MEEVLPVRPGGIANLGWRGPVVVLIAVIACLGFGEKAFAADCTGTAGDEFAGSSLDRDKWPTMLREHPGDFSVSGGSFRQRVLRGDMNTASTASTRNMPLQVLPNGPWTVTAKVNIAETIQSDRIGLLAWRGEAPHTWGKISFMNRETESPGNQWRVERKATVNNTTQGGTVATANAPRSQLTNNDFWLRIVSDGAVTPNLTYQYSLNGTTFTSVTPSLPLGGTAPIQVTLVARGHDIVSDPADPRSVAVPARSVYWDWVRVDTTNCPPAVSLEATSATEGAGPLEVDFEGAVTNGAGGDGSPAIAWDFGDGSTETGQTARSHTFSTPGTYRVRFSATDSFGNVARDSVWVTVTDPATPACTDNFNGNSLNLSNNNEFKWDSVLSAQDRAPNAIAGKLRIPILAGDWGETSSHGMPVPFAATPADGGWTATAKLNLADINANNEQTGLIVHKSHGPSSGGFNGNNVNGSNEFSKLIYINKGAAAHQFEFSVTSRASAAYTTEVTQLAAPAPYNAAGNNEVYLRVRYDGWKLIGQWSPNGTAWNTVGLPANMAPEPGKPIKVGLMAGRPTGAGTGANEGGNVDFDWFQMDCGPEVELDASDTELIHSGTVDFVATVSDDEDDAEDITIHWDFGDGTTASGGTERSHTFTEPGNYRVVVTATDTDGNTSTANEKIVVKKVPGGCTDKITDEFSGNMLDPKWNFIRPRISTVNVTGGNMTIKGNGGDISGATADMSNLLLQNAPNGNWVALAKLDISEMTVDGDQAGIALWVNEGAGANNFAKVFVTRRPGTNLMRYERMRTLNSGTASGGNAGDIAFAPTVYVRVTKTGNLAKTEMSVNGTSWTMAANDFDLTQFGAGQLRIGLFYRQPSSAHRTVKFDYFRVERPGCDAIAPTTALSTSPASPDGDNGWFISNPVEVTLSATDNSGGDGVDYTEYRINGGPWAEYTAPLDIDNEGATLLDYRSVDNNENHEAVASAIFSIDSQAPVSSHTLNPASGPYLAPSPVELTLSSTDPLSGAGLQRIEYSTDDGDNWTTYSGSSKPAFTAEGEYEILYRGVDGAGNVESPAGTATFEIVAGGNNDCQTSKTDEFDGSSLDPKWTVNNPNGAGNLAVGGGNFSQVLLTGDISGHFGGGSGAKNTILQPVPHNQPWVATQKMDISDVRVGSNQIGFVLWANGQTDSDGGNRQWAKVTMAKLGTTGGSGGNWFVEWAYRNGNGDSSQNIGSQPDKPNILYQRIASNGANPPFIRTDYSFDGVHWRPIGAAGGFTFNGGAFLSNLHIGLSAFAFSDGGQTSASFDYFRLCDIAEDQLPPITTHQLSPAAGFGPGGDYTVPVEMTLSASDGDEGSTIDKTEYRVNGGSWTTKSGGTPLVFSADGDYTVDYRSVDMAGNVETTRTATFGIDRTAASSCTVDPDEFNGGSLSGGRWTSQLRALGVSVSGGQVHIPITNSDYNGGTATAPTILTPVPTGPGSWAAETVVDTSSFGGQEGNQAGIVVWQNEGEGTNNFTKFVVNRRAVPNYWVERVRTLDSNNASGFPNGGLFSTADNPKIGVRVEYNHSTGALNFRYSQDNGVTWLKPSNTVADVFGDFSSATNTRVGLTAMGSSTASGTASFDSFRVESPGCQVAIAPQVSVSTPSPGGANDWHTTKPVPASLLVTDPSGLVTASPEYRTGGSGPFVTYASPVAINDEGATLVEGRVAYGLSQAQGSATVKIDTVAPASSHSLNPGNGPNNTPDPVSVELDATDATSGVALIEYSTNDGTTWTNYDDGNPPTFTTAGTHRLLYRAIDNAGNTESPARLASVLIEPVAGNSACLNAATDEFNGIGVDPKWSILRPNPARYSVAHGSLNVQFGGINTELNGATANAVNVFRQPVPAAGNWSLTTRMDLRTAKQQSNQAGIVLWQNEGASLNNFARVTFNARPNDASPGWWVERQATVNSSSSGNGGGNTGTFPLPIPDDLFLRVVVVPDGANRVVSAFFSTDGFNWQPARPPFTITNAATYPIQAGLVLVRGENNPTGGVDYHYARFCEFGSDDEAPFSSAALTPAAPDGDNGWYRTPPVGVELSAIDVEPGSGLERIEYSTNGGSSWSTYSTSLTVSAEGDNEVLHRGVDRGGNIEVAKTASVKVDTVAPVSTHELDPATGPYVFPTSVSVNLDATDASSGIARIEYSTDGGGTWQTYDDGTPPAFTTVGSHELLYRAVDNAGHVESPAKTAIVDIVEIDPVAPETSHALAPASPDGNNGWYKTAPTVTLNVVDPDTDPEDVDTFYRVGGTGSFLAYTGPFPVITNGEDVQVEYYSEDGDFTEDTSSFTVDVDTTIPVVVAELDSEGPYREPVGVTFSFDAEDATSGVASGSLEYSTDGGTTWLHYTEPVAFTTADTYTVHYRASDNAGNVGSGSTSFQVRAESVGVGRKLSIKGLSAGAQEVHTTGGSHNPAASLIDGNYSTRWSTTGTLATSWVEFDLGSAQDVDRLRFAFEMPGATYPMSITAGATTAPTDVVFAGNVVSNPVLGEMTNIEFTSVVNARYVRVSFTGNWTPRPEGGQGTVFNYFSGWEAALYNSDATPQTCTPQRSDEFGGSTLNEAGKWVRHTTNGGTPAGATTVANGRLTMPTSTGELDGSATGPINFIGQDLSAWTSAVTTGPGAVNWAAETEFNATFTPTAASYGWPQMGLVVWQGDGNFFRFTLLRHNDNGSVFMEASKDNPTNTRVNNVNSPTVNAAAATQPPVRIQLRLVRPNTDVVAGQFRTYNTTTQAWTAWSNPVQTSNSSGSWRIDGGLALNTSPRRDSAGSRIGLFAVSGGSPSSTPAAVANFEYFRVSPDGQSGCADDTTAPTTAASTVPASPDGTNGWFKTVPTVSLTAADDVDNGAPVRTQFGLGSAAWSDYVTGHRVTTQGVNAFNYRSSDAADNIEPTKTLEVKVDTTAPSVSHVMDPATGPWFEGDGVDLSLVSDDTTSGVDLVEYSTDNGENWSEFEESLSFTDAGAYTVLYRATDLAGNVTSGSATFEVLEEGTGSAFGRKLNIAGIRAGSQEVNTTGGSHNPVASLLDGNDSTRWSTNNSGSANNWVEFDLGSPQLVDTLRMSFEQPNAQYPILVTAGTAAAPTTAVFTGNAATGPVATDMVAVPFTAPVVARYVRVQFTANWIPGNVGGGAWHSAWEAALYNSAGSPRTCTPQRSDEFGGTELNETGKWLRHTTGGGTPAAATTVADGRLTVPTNAAEIDGSGTGPVNFIGQDLAGWTAAATTTGSAVNWVAETEFTATYNATASQYGWPHLGLIVWVSDGNFFRYTLTRDNGNGSVYLEATKDNPTNSRVQSNGPQIYGSGAAHPPVRVQMRVVRPNSNLVAAQYRTWNTTTQLWGGWSEPVRTSGGHNISGGLQLDTSPRRDSAGSRIGIIAGGSFSASTQPAATASFEYFRVGPDGQSDCTIDVTAPTTTATTSPAAPQGSQDWFTTSPVTVSLTAADNLDNGARVRTRFAQNTGAWTEYVTGHRVTAQGTTNFHYRSTDAADNTEATNTLPVKIDTVVPTASHALTPASGPYASPAGVELAINATDATSGVALVEYSDDAGATWTEYEGPVDFDEVGTYAITYRSTDNAGHVSTTGSVNFTVNDGTAPVSTHTFDPAAPDGAGGAWLPGLELSLSATDNVSDPGDITIEYSDDDGATWTDYDEPVEFNDEGEYEILYRAIDEADNTENPANSVEFEITNTMPNLAPEVITVTATPDEGLIPLLVEFSVTATDPNEDDVLEYEWDFDDGSATSDEEDPSHTYTDPGIYEATVTVTDGELSDSDSVTVTVTEPDPIAPETSHALAPSIADGSNGWYKTTPVVTLSVVDPDSDAGDVDTYFRIGGTGAYAPYTAPFEIETDGEDILVEYYSTDEELTETTNSFTVDVDTTNPVVTAQLNPAAGPYIEPTGVTLTLLASDATSGVTPGSGEYSIDNGANWLPYTAPVAFTDPGEYTVDYRASDNAGNTGANEVSFEVEEAAPLSGLGRKINIRSITAGAQATSTTAGEHFPVAGMIDGNPTTRWGTGNPAPAANLRWFEVDLGSSQTVDVMKIAVFNGHQRRYPLLITAGNSPAPTNVVFSGNTDFVTAQAEYDTVEFNAPVTARYIRVLQNGTSLPDASQFFGVWEVEFFDMNSEPQTCTAVRSDEFSGTTLDPAKWWRHTRNGGTPASATTLVDGKLRTRAGQYELDTADATTGRGPVNFIGQDLFALTNSAGSNWVVETEFTASYPTTSAPYGWQHVGLILWNSTGDGSAGPDNNFIRYTLTRDSGTGRLFVEGAKEVPGGTDNEGTRTQSANNPTISAAAATQSPVRIRMRVARAANNFVNFQHQIYNPATQTWGAWSAVVGHQTTGATPFRMNDGFELNPASAARRDAAGSKIGIIAGGQFLAAQPADVDVEYFRVSPDEYVDCAQAVPPVTTHTIDPETPDGPEGAWLPGVEVSLAATDDISDDEDITTQYSQDGGSTWQTYSGPITLTQTATHTILYRSTDEAGNVETAKTVTVRVAKAWECTVASDEFEGVTLDANRWSFRRGGNVTPPALPFAQDGQLKFQLGGNELNGTGTGSIQTFGQPMPAGDFTAVAKMNGDIMGDTTGIANQYAKTGMILYQSDAQFYQVSKVRNAGAGSYLGYTYFESTREVTNASNSSAQGDYRSNIHPQTWWLRIQRIGNQLTGSFAHADPYAGGQWYPLNHAGNDTALIFPTADPVYLGFHGGNGSNVMSVDYLRVTPETYDYCPGVPVPPETSHALAPPTPDGDGGWYKTAPTVTLTVDDPESDPQDLETFFRIGGVGAFQPYTAPFPVNADGENVLVEYYTSDLEYTEEVRSFTIDVDTTAPVLDAVRNPANPPYSTGNGGVAVTISATDATSGVASGSLEYSLDGGDTWSPVSGPVQITAPGSTTIQYRANDNAGNTGTGQMAVQVSSSCTQMSDNFNGTALDEQKWDTVLREYPGFYRLENGQLRMRVLTGDINPTTDASAKNNILQTMPAGPWTATAKLDVTGSIASDQVGLMIWRAETPNHYWGKAVYNHRPDSSNTTWWIERNATVNNTVISGGGLNSGLQPQANITNGELWVRLSSDGAATPNITTSYSTNGNSFTNVGTAFAFPGPGEIKVGPLVRAGSSSTERWYGFDSFEVETPANCPPMVEVAAASATAGPGPLSVDFTSTIDDDSDGAPDLDFTWDFGDGQTDSANANPTHVYTDPGTYRAKLTVTDSDGASTSRSVLVTVTNPAQPTCVDNFNGNALNTSNNGAFKWNLQSRLNGGPVVTGGGVRIPMMRNGEVLGGAFRTTQMPVAVAPIGRGWTATVRFNSNGIDVSGEQAGLAFFRSAGPLPSGSDADNFFSKAVYIRPGTDAQARRFEHIVTSNANNADFTIGDGSQSNTAAPAPLNAAGNHDILMRGRYDGAWLIAEFSPNNGTSWTQIGQRVHVGGNLKVGLIAIGNNNATSTNDSGGPASATNGDIVFDRFEMDCGPTVEVQASETSGKTPLPVDFTATVTDDEDAPGDIQIAWDFANGTTASGGLTRSHTFTSPGIHRVKVTATDTDGNVSVGWATVNVELNRSGNCLLPQTDEFSGDTLDPKWNVLRPNPSGVRLENGSLVRKGYAGDQSGANANSRNVMLQNVPTGPWVLETRLNVADLTVVGDQAGIILWRSESPNNFVKFVFNRRAAGATGNFWFETGKTVAGSTTGTGGGNTGNVGAAQQDILMRVTATNAANPVLVAQYSLNGGTTWVDGGGTQNFTVGGTGQLQFGLVYFQDNVMRNARWDYFRVTETGCDAVLPTVNHAMTPAVPDGLGGAWKPGVTMTLTASDNVTPAQDITVEYRVGSGAWQPYTGAIPFNSEGTFNVQYRATDANANVGTGSFSFTVSDDEPELPVTSHTIAPAAPDGTNGWYKTVPTVTLTVDDPDSTPGQINTFFRIGGTGAFQPYTAPFPVAGDGEDILVEYYSTDEAGTEATSSFTLDIDATDPNVAATLNPASGPYFAPAGVTLSITASDATSGLTAASPEYSTNGGTSWTTYTAPIAFTTPGARTVQFRATDLAGNVKSDQISFTVQAEPLAPTTSHTVAPPAPDGNNGWYKNAPTVTLTVDDSDSDAGDLDTFFRIGGSGAFQAYTAPFPVSTNGDNVQVEYYSTDEQHTEGTHSFTLDVDTVNPVVGATLNPASGPYVAPTGVQVSVSATDATSGVLTGSIEYSTNGGGTWVAYTGPVSFTTAGNHTVHFRAADNAGNTNSGQINFTVDPAPVPPVTSHTVAPPAPDGNNGWYKNAPTVTLSVTDPDSTPGQLNTFFRIGGSGAFQAYTAPFPVSTNGDNVQVQYYTTDQQHTETTKSFTLDVDTVNPVVGTTLNPASGPYVAPTGVQVAVTTSDVTSGILTGSIEYSTNGGTTWGAYTGPVSFTTAGNHTMHFRAADNAGNTNSGQISFTVDGAPVPPVTSHTLNPAAPNGNGGWYRTAPTVTLAVNDPDSNPGQVNTFFRLGGSGAFSPYTAPFTVTGDGLGKQVEYHTTDEQHTETTKSFTVNVDATNPTVGGTLAPATGTYYPYNALTLTVTAADATSGLANGSPEFSTDNGQTWLPVTAPILFTESGEYVVQLRATDLAGNLATDQVSFTVEPEMSSCLAEQSDQFDTGPLNTARWSKSIGHDPAGYSFANGSILLPTAHSELSAAAFNAPNVLLQPMPGGDNTPALRHMGAWEAATRVTLDATAANQQAGLVMHADNGNFAKLMLIAQPGGTRQMSFYTVTDGVERNVTGQDFMTLPSNFPTTFHLRLMTLGNSSTGRQATAAYSVDGEAWLPVGRVFDIDDSIGDWSFGIAASAGATTPSIPIVNAAFANFHVIHPNDDFDGDYLQMCRWTNIVNHDSAGYEVGDGYLKLPTEIGELSVNNPAPPNMIMRPVPNGAWETTTKVTLETTRHEQQAGLVLYSNPANFAKLVMQARPPGEPEARRIAFSTAANGIPRNTAQDVLYVPDSFPSTFYLRMTSTGGTARAAVSADGVDWTPVGRTFSQSGAAAGSWNVGMTAHSGGAPAGDPTTPIVDALFDWIRFDVDPGEPVVVSNEPPVIISATGAPATGIAPHEVAFGVNAIDPDDDDLTYSWDFDDGSPVSSTQDPVHTYTEPGTYEATVTVSDGALTDTESVTIVVEEEEEPGGNQAPVLTVATGTPATGSLPLSVTFNASASDPDGDSVTYAWEFGDGGTSNSQNPTHTYMLPGTYQATVTVTDGELTDTETVTVVVGGTTPDMVAPASQMQLNGAAPVPLYTGPVTATFSATDTGGSGVAKIQYRISSAGIMTWTDYVPASPPIVSTHGPHAIEYRGVDNAGNSEQIHVTFFSVDLGVVDPLLPNIRMTITPRKRNVHATAKSSTFNVVVTNNGDGAAQGVTLCIKVPKHKLEPRLMSGRCVTVNSIEPGASETVKFKVKILAKAVGKSNKVKFTAAGTGFTPKTATATLKVKKP